MIEKTIQIDGKDFTFRSSALVPKLYRAHFGRDMVQDMRRLAKAYKDTQGDQDKTLDIVDLEVFERVAWIMLRHAGMNAGNDPDEWLMSLDSPFSFYEVMPTLMDLWHRNNKTTSVPKKK